MQNIINDLVFISRKHLQNKKTYQNSFLLQAVSRKYFSSTLVQGGLSLAEAGIISPNRLSLNFMADICNNIRILTRNSSNSKLKNYVSFNRLPFNELDKIFCDWCSICNGLTQYCEDLLNDAIKDQNTNIFSWQCTSRFTSYAVVLKTLRYIPKSVVKHLYDKSFVEQKCSSFKENISAAFPNANPRELRKLMKSIKQLVIIQHLIECIEHRWCPFSHLKELAYQPKDYLCFDWTQNAHLKKAAELLSQKGSIQCHECSKYLNQLSQSEEPMPSLFDEYFKVLVR